MKLYDRRPQEYWQKVWIIICDMSYLRRNISEKIYIKPFDKKFFSSEYLEIPEEITLDYMWKQYSEKYHEVEIVPELKEIYVPRELFLDLGVETWFKYSFPNCVINFW